MALINLIPWREQLREERQKQFLSTLAVALCLTFVVIVLIHIAVSYSISQQKKRNSRLTDEIHSLNGKLMAISSLKDKKDRLLMRINIIKDLQANRPLAVYLFDEIVRITPQGVFFKKIERKNNTIILEGVAESHSQVSILMRRVENSKWLSKPQLSEIKEKDKDDRRLNRFELTVRINPPHTAMVKEV